MNNIGEVIIHGKPYAGSSKMTGGLDTSFANTFVDAYFNEMGNFNYPESFIVEARLWKGVWYGVYTFMLYKGITDTADRKSFFALSIVTPNQYYCLTSEVYNALRKVCAEYVIGHYLSRNGKYLVQDFEDASLFNGLVSRISEGWVNLQESFDNGFKPQNEYPNNVLYNVVDCDSKAFIQTLRQKGRIVICESAPSKDDRLTNVNNIQAKLLQANQTISDIKGKLNLAEKEKEDLRKGGGKAERENRELKTRIGQLKREKETLQTSKDATEEKLQGVKSKLSDIMTVMEVGKNPVTPKKPSNKKYLFPLSLLNTVLLVLVILMSLKNCSSKEETHTSDADIKDYSEIENIVRRVMDENTNEINALRQSIEESLSKPSTFQITPINVPQKKQETEKKNTTKKTSTKSNDKKSTEEKSSDAGNSSTGANNK